MPYSTPEKKKAHNQKYAKDWYAKNKERIHEQQRQYRLSMRLKVLQHYSQAEEPSCQCCGEKVIEFLSLDHVNGGGNKHRSSEKIYHIWLWIEKNGYPEGYRVLCHNCNHAIGSYGKCPHKL